MIAMTPRFDIPAYAGLTT